MQRAAIGIITDACLSGDTKQYVFSLAGKTDVHYSLPLDTWKKKKLSNNTRVKIIVDDTTADILSIFSIPAAKMTPLIDTELSTMQVVPPYEDEPMIGFLEARSAVEKHEQWQNRCDTAYREIPGNRTRHYGIGTVKRPYSYDAMILIARYIIAAYLMEHAIYVYVPHVRPGMFAYIYKIFLSLHYCAHIDERPQDEGGMMTWVDELLQFSHTKMPTVDELLAAHSKMGDENVGSILSGARPGDTSIYAKLLQSVPFDRDSFCASGGAVGYFVSQNGSITLARSVGDKPSDTN